MTQTTFITGPAYSGKSELVHQRLQEIDDVLYVACAVFPHPSELFNRRVKKLQSMRNANWTTAEILKDGDTTFQKELSSPFAAVVLDSVSLWLGYQINSGIKKFNPEELYDHIVKESRYLFQDMQKIGKEVYLLSTEVGFCPPGSHELENLYRMLLADINREYAARSQQTEIVLLGQEESSLCK